MSSLDDITVITTEFYTRSHRTVKDTPIATANPNNIPIISDRFFIGLFVFMNEINRPISGVLQLRYKRDSMSMQLSSFSIKSKLQATQVSNLFFYTH